MAFQYEQMKEDLRRQLKAVEVVLDRFEAEEKRKGNPRAIAGLPPAEWGPLPAEIETLYDLQWELASEFYRLYDWPPEPILPEPCPGCGWMLDEEGCDTDGAYHYGPEGCANYSNHNGWQDKL